MNSELDDVEKLLDSLVAKEKDDEVLIGWFARGRLHLTKKRSPQRFFKPSERQAEVGVPFLEELHFLRTDCRRERVFCHRPVTFPVAPSTSPMYASRGLGAAAPEAPSRPTAASRPASSPPCGCARRGRRP